MNALYGFKKQINKKISLTKGWVEKNERYLSVAFFALGLVFDILTATRVDLFFDNLILVIYLFLAILGICVLYALQVRNYPLESKIYRFIPFLAQYSFGGLFSRFVVYYTKSASWTTSWIFLLILLVAFLGNERFRKHYKKVDFQINILYIALFSFLVFFVPIVLKKMGVEIFLLSGLLSIFVIYILVSFMSRFIASITKERKRKMARHILGVFFVFNLLYFLNIIPPIPLSMKEIGLYDYVGKGAQGEYVFEKFDFPWYSMGNHFLKIEPNDSVYVYSSIFAPTDLNITVYNVWQKYNSVAREWEERGEVSYLIQGGRDEGYRGYSFVSGVDEGKWRVSVETKEGLVIGRLYFDVK